MLVINRQQMQQLEGAAFQRFEDEMQAHAKLFAPTLAMVLGDAPLRIAVGQAIGMAQAHGFTNRGPIRLCVELMFLFGSGFDTDPQYPALGELLRDGGDQMDRAEAMYDVVVDYLATVAGPGNANVRAALESLENFARSPMRLSSADFTAGMLWELRFTFAQKAAYVGDRGLLALIESGRQAARRYGFTSVRAQALLVALQFAFGHGCLDDPLYPWISRTLADGHIVDPAARAARLEKKALTWLDHVLARPRGLIAA